MTVYTALQNVREIRIKNGGRPVCHTAAQELQKHSGAKIVFTDVSAQKLEAGILTIALAGDFDLTAQGFSLSAETDRNSLFFRLQADGSGCIVACKPFHLYGMVCDIIDRMKTEELARVSDGCLVQPAFAWQRLSYDYFISQEGRIQRNLDSASYLKNAARMGFTHIDVNGLAYPMALETGPKGETYSMFYTYCPALDQFVYSELNKGIYPYYYLAANLDYLKKNAEIAESYGLVPGLTCFEPRSVPEHFFERYPMLRGARVDHPFRSFKPRYNMTTTHPKVLDHYAEMVQKLLTAVPQLGFLSVWTSDSGAGFEHTKSLYVGRNGGAYLIREWNDDQSIAKLAIQNVSRFFQTLKTAASRINPEFRVMTRLEPFYGEHEWMWQEFGDRFDVETTSLIAKGWSMPYTHPKYDDVKEINGGTIYQGQFSEEETKKIEELKKRDAWSHFYFAAGPHTFFEPLMGVPYPRLTWEKLKRMHGKVDCLAHIGGTCPPNLVPFNINHEIVARHQYDPQANVDQIISGIAENWAGKACAADLVQAWSDAEEAILAFPNVTGLYSTFGFTWYRLWVRPLVPDYESVPADERAYYEDFMCSTPHNPNNVDLSRDVLFQLTTLEKCRKILERIDGNLWDPLDRAIARLEKRMAEADASLGTTNVVRDQAIRLRALKCWFMTQRNVAAWVVGVHGYLRGENETERENSREILKKAIRAEIENTRELQQLYGSGIEFMIISGQGETPLVYGDNIAELFPLRIQLMEKHIDDEPYFDDNYIVRKAGERVQ
ncbi:hypothetical protein JW992_06520 [candidate division KSB1 bacterium]|nr:hypothetical protein [candidate division KSB1 bacterium]